MRFRGSFDTSTMRFAGCGFFDDWSGLWDASVA